MSLDKEKKELLQWLDENAPRFINMSDHFRQKCARARGRIQNLHFMNMFNTTLRIVGDPDDAEDVIQEAFLKAFAKLDSYRGEVSFGAWLKRIMINKALDFLRLKKEQLSLEDAGEIGEMVEEEAEDAEYKYSAETIRKAIYALPEGYRIVLSLILLEGYDHEEVSLILNVSNATSRTQYHRAKKKLIALLKQSK